MVTNRSKSAGSTGRYPGLFEKGGYLRRDIKYSDRPTREEIDNAPLVLHDRYRNIPGFNVYGGTERGKNLGEVKVKQHTRNRPKK